MVGLERNKFIDDYNASSCDVIKHVPDVVGHVGLALLHFNANVDSVIESL